jgi:hypothetical protein
MSYEHLTTDDYRDPSGRKWFCVRMEDSMDCQCEDGSWTSAYCDTFVRWGWKKLPPHERQEGGSL